MRDLVVPPRGALPKTSVDDPVDYYYGLTAPLYRARLALAARVLGSGHGALVDIGYGSGIFFPELARRAQRLVGIELHEDSGVREGLAKLGIEVELRKGSIYGLPARDGEFDAAVCLSVLEHLESLEPVLLELRRVLVTGAVAVLGFPVRHVATDAFFRVFGYDAREMHPSSHEDILRALHAAPGFVFDGAATFPRFLPLGLSAYVVCRLRAV
jgi:SAM-dependent methyltransferase